MLQKQRCNPQLICALKAFVFIYVKRSFSHDAAHILDPLIHHFYIVKLGFKEVNFCPSNTEDSCYY